MGSFEVFSSLGFGGSSSVGSALGKGGGGFGVSFSSFEDVLGGEGFGPKFNNPNTAFSGVLDYLFWKNNLQDILKSNIY